MRLLETWVDTPLVGALGWALLHSLWIGAVISIALASVLIATRSPRVRYAAACVSMLAMLAGFAIALAALFPAVSDPLRITAASAFPPWSVQSAMDARGPSTSGLASIAPWLALFWIAGVSMFFIGQGVSWLSVCRVRSRGVCSVSDHWRAQLARLSARLHLTHPVQMLESCLVDAPMVVGHFRPLILMPVGLLAGLPLEQVEAILLHELAHIRRYDYLVNVLQRAVEGLLFYHPATWWMSRVIRAERENCCDDVVVATIGDAHRYAVALAALEDNRCSGREPAVAATGGSLMKRIHRLLYPEGPNGAWTPLLGAVILIATAAATLAAWQAAPAQHGAASNQQEEGRTATTPYLKWLNEDVLFMASAEERAAFLKLTSDEEREMFIEQFWLRRDPTPGTPTNELKEEHYRRIAYSNERFRRPGGAGWQSDRGRMYIMYGPPDELEVHPKSAQREYAREAWLYRYIQGIGNNLIVTFIDRNGTGDFQIAPGTGR